MKGDAPATKLDGRWEFLVCDPSINRRSRERGQMGGNFHRYQGRVVTHGERSFNWVQSPRLHSRSMGWPQFSSRAPMVPLRCHWWPMTVVDSREGIGVGEWHSKNFSCSCHYLDFGGVLSKSNRSRSNVLIASGRDGLGPGCAAIQASTCPSRSGANRTPI